MVDLLVPAAGRNYNHLASFSELDAVETVVTTEIDPYAPGIQAADRAFKVPKIGDDDYIPTLRRICRQEGIDAVIPMKDLDLVHIGRERQTFERDGVDVLASPRSTIQVANDQLESWHRLASEGVPYAETLPGSDWEDAAERLGFPMIIKPRYSTISGDRYRFTKVDSQDELSQAVRSLHEVSDYVVQEYLEGTELTLDFFCDAQGQARCVVPAERLEAMSPAFSQHGGRIVRSRTLHDPDLVAFTRNAIDELDFVGPANFQGYRNEEGEVRLTEINPRFTGATAFAKEAGANFFEWSVDLLDGSDLADADFSYDSVTMTGSLRIHRCDRKTLADPPA